MTVSVICEECGKIYHVSADRLRQIKGDSARTKCRNCGHIIFIRKVEPESPMDSDMELIDVDQLAPNPPEPAMDIEIPSAPAPSVSRTKERRARKGASRAGALKLRGFGLRAKIIVLFLIAPLVMMAASGYVSQRQTQSLVNALIRQSSALVNQLSENAMSDIGRAVAQQVQAYLVNNPQLKPRNFETDPILSRMAIQRVGRTGYTFLYSTGPLIYWLHPDSRLHGKDMAGEAQRLLGKDYDAFGQIIEPLENGENIPRRGTYLWKGNDGVVRQKFILMTPIRGTRYGIGTTTDIDEVSRPLKQMADMAHQKSVEARRVNLIILIVALVLVSLIVSVYGHRLVGRIKHLTDVADRISVGELDAQIHIRSNDEIGNLANAIARMQDSLRLSIMRLRKRR